MGQLALQLVHLNDTEVVHVLGLKKFSMKYDDMRAVLLEVYPRGSHTARRGSAPAWRHGHQQAPVTTGGDDEWSTSGDWDAEYDEDPMKWNPTRRPMMPRSG